MFNVPDITINMLSQRCVKKVVLVDFDGVILRNKIADIKVAKRAGIYTWKKLNQLRPNHKVIGPKQGDDICYNLYKGYGHSLTGLKGIGVSTCSMKDYNKLVYDTIDYDIVRKNNNSFDDTRALINYCHESNYDIFFFSNAPHRWMENVLQKDKDILLSMEDIRKVIGVDEDDERFLKPGPHIYEAIDSHFKNENIIFIDDNIGNIRPVLNKVHWTNICVSSACKKINNKLHFVDGLETVIDII